MRRRVTVFVLAVFSTLLTVAPAVASISDMS